MSTVGIEAVLQDPSTERDAAVVGGDSGLEQPLGDDAPPDSANAADIPDTAGTEDTGPARRGRTRLARILAYGLLPTVALLLAGAAGYLKFVDGTARYAEIARAQSVQAAIDSTVAQTIPKGTYSGVSQEVTSVALPAGAYTTTRMSNATAYAVTKAFWSQKATLARRNPPWAAVTPDALAALGVKLHRGALRYYKEAGVSVPAALR